MWPAVGTEGGLHFSQLAGHPSGAHLFKQTPKSRSEAQATCFSRPGSVLALMFPPQMRNARNARFLKIWHQKSRNNSGFYLTWDIPLKSLPSHLVTWRYNLPLKRRRLSSPFRSKGRGRLLQPQGCSALPSCSQSWAETEPRSPQATGSP